MKTFTGFQWLLIDAANQFGKDKLRFEERLEWAKVNLDNLESLLPEAETKPLYLKAVQAIRKAQQHIPTGHLVGVDASASGMQLMSVLAGCLAGCEATGLVDPDCRADAYTQCTDTMNSFLKGRAVTVDRSDAKQALMTAFYGSKKQPEEIFGEDTPELQAFLKAAQMTAPGAWELLQVLIQSWNPYALSHDWKLPDGFDAHVKVLKKVKTRIRVAELDGASFTYEYFDNQGSKKGLSNAANVVHSVDAFVLREMHRRCHYDTAMVDKADWYIEAALMERLLGVEQETEDSSERITYFKEQYARSGMVTAAILPCLDLHGARCLSKQHLQALALLTESMLSHPSFDLVCIHDEFKAHANNVDQIRRHYKEILAEIAESHLLEDLLSQLYKEPCAWDKGCPDLGKRIRESNYAVC